MGNNTSAGARWPWLISFAMLCACGASASPTSPGDGDAGIDVATDRSVDAVPDVVCNGGARQPPGGACRCAADCEVGSTCATEEESGFPGGMCLRSCDPSEAPRAGLLCRSEDGVSVYVPTCGPSVSTPCRDGWYCRVFLGATRPQDRYQCEPQCSSDTQCSTGHCNRYTGTCQPEAEGAPNGDPCTVPDQCRSGLCLRSGLGACNSLCDVRTGYCPDNGFCLPSVQADAGAQNGTCLARCASLADCRMGFTCMRYQGQGLCVPTSL